MLIARIAVIARCGRFLFLSLLLFLSSVSYPRSPHFLSSLTASSTSHLLSFRAPVVSFPLFSSLAECERLHLHLNLAVDLAVVRDHHSCRGKGRLQYFQISQSRCGLSRSTFSYRKGRGSIFFSFNTGKRVAHVRMSLNCKWRRLN